MGHGISLQAIAIVYRSILFAVPIAELPIRSARQIIAINKATIATLRTMATGTFV